MNFRVLDRQKTIFAQLECHHLFAPNSHRQTKKIGTTVHRMLLCTIIADYTANFLAPHCDVHFDSCNCCSISVEFFAKIIFALTLAQCGFRSAAGGLCSSTSVSRDCCSVPLSLNVSSFSSASEFVCDVIEFFARRASLNRTISSILALRRTATSWFSLSIFMKKLFCLSNCSFVSQGVSQSVQMLLQLKFRGIQKVSRKNKILQSDNCWSEGLSRRLRHFAQNSNFNFHSIEYTEIEKKKKIRSPNPIAVESFALGRVTHTNPVRR